jgi:hypothetical protein
MAHSGFLEKVIILFVSSYSGVSPLSTKGGTQKEYLSKLMNRSIIKPVYIVEIEKNMPNNITESEKSCRHF